MHILIVDGHDFFRQGLAQSLIEETQIESVIEANSCASACRLLDTECHQLNLAIVDHDLPDGSGLTLLKEMRKLYPLLPVVVLSASEDAELMQKSIDTGALAFIAKYAPSHILLCAIKLILSGGIYILPNPYYTYLKVKAVSNSSLTKRQNDVLRLLRCGHSNKEIAYQLGITEATVKAHVTAILKFCGVSSRTRLVVSQQDS